MSLRVNARFEGVVEQQLNHLAKSMDISVSEVLRLSVESYYQQVLGRQRELRHFSRHIGRHDGGRSDSSARYKEAVAQVIDAKHQRDK